MGLGFVTYRPAMADPEPPQPLPFPIRIVSDPSPPPPSADDLQPAPPISTPGGKRDLFYQSWDKFLSVQSKRTRGASRESRKLEAEKSKVEDTQPDGLQTEENASKSWQQAANECKIKVAAIVEECRRLNQKYRDAIFDLEANLSCLQSLNGQFPKAVNDGDAPPWIKRVEDIFEKPQFFIDGATATDVHQGAVGDCWFLAALMAVSAKKELIENLCVARDEQVGVYGFVFYRDGEWIYEVIDDKLFLKVGDDDDLKVIRNFNKPDEQDLKHDEDNLKEKLQTGGEALYFSHCNSNETWLPLIEKAYAKAHGDYHAIEGGFASEGIEDLTGGVAVVINPEDIMDKDRFWKEQLSQVNKDYLFGGGSKSAGSKGFVGNHAYTVLETFEEDDIKLLKLRNPWGSGEWQGDWSDGSKKWTPELMLKLKHTFGDDGIFWISYKDFIKHFPTINRVRLFDSDWTVAQQWTCVNVPWTVDYLDTRFQLDVTTKGPIVIVLSQPDDRYFYGLRGRYLYSLHFRLYKQGEDDEGGRYLVRSMHNSGNETVFTRSVSAELEDLEPGKYDVLFKVTAVRVAQNTQEEAILKYAVSNKEKLLHVGRRYDYAQTKGNLRAMEKANRREKREAKKEKLKKCHKRDRKLNMQQRERDRARKERIDAAMKEKKKALQEKEKAKRRARREWIQEKRQKRKEAKEALEANELDKDPEQCNDTAMQDGYDSPTLRKNAEDKVVTPPEEIDDEAASTSGQVSGLNEEESKQPEDPRAAVTKEDSLQAPKTTEPEPRLEQTEPPNPESLSDTDRSKGPPAEISTIDKTEADQSSLPEGGAKGANVDKIIEPLAHLELQSKKKGKERSKGTSATTNAFGSRTSRSRHSSRTPSDRSGSVSSSSDYDSPPEVLDELEDDDFEWDSAIDGPIDSDTSSGSSSRRRRGSANLDIFADDPWNAVCVLGLRVYSKGEVGIKVVKGRECREG